MERLSWLCCRPCDNGGVAFEGKMGEEPDVVICSEEIKIESKHFIFHVTQKKKRFLHTM